MASKANTLSATDRRERASLEFTPGSAVLKGWRACISLKRMMGQTINLELAVVNFYQPLYRFAYSLTRNEAEALDLTQQTFLLLSQHAHQIKAHPKLKSWLFTTLRREFLRGARRQSRHPEVAFEAEQHEVAAAAEQAGGRAADAHSILEALERVEETYRTTLKLFYLGELSYREIAEMLSIPIGTVMSRLSRGKEQLRAKLAHLLNRDARNSLGAGSNKTSKTARRPGAP